MPLQKGRGPRLSFLGGRKKDQQPPREVNGDHHQAAIQEETEPIPSGATAKSTTSSTKEAPTNNRRSFFRTLPQMTASEAGTASSRERGGGVHTNGTGPGPYYARSQPSQSHLPDLSPGGSEVFSSPSPATVNGGFGIGVGGGGSEKGAYHAQVYETTPPQHPASPPAAQQQQGHSSIMGHGVGSVRKRLSILRLGKKSSRERGGGLGGVDEE